ncbi:hypothetical protein VPNG_06870 [Cytospora leucostoma]|uniref:Uncharacterized protein n=1 Tax=Cytospora leucostoma TaxID=1230097 RepID=A0A423WVY7_9PEZI|nr:hypothetical protein VPNG_06870 [Cytospora leucostoma]
MKSPVLATIGGLAVLGQAQQPTLHAVNVSSVLTPLPQDSSGSPANATIAVANVNIQTKAIVLPVPLPTTVTTTYTPDYRATCRATVIAGYTRTFCNTPEPTQRGPLRKPHGSVHEYVPEDDISENPRIVIDPERACHRGYSCQPDGGHKSHGDVYRSGDDVEKLPSQRVDSSFRLSQALPRRQMLGRVQWTAFSSAAPACLPLGILLPEDTKTQVIEIVFTQFNPGFHGLFREFVTFITFVTFADANEDAIACNFRNFCIRVRVSHLDPRHPSVNPHHSTYPGCHCAGSLCFGPGCLSPRCPRCPRDLNSMRIPGYDYLDPMCVSASCPSPNYLNPMCLRLRCPRDLNPMRIPSHDYLNPVCDSSRRPRTSPTPTPSSDYININPVYINSSCLPSCAVSRSTSRSTSSATSSATSCGPAGPANPQVPCRDASLPAPQWDHYATYRHKSWGRIRPACCGHGHGHCRCIWNAYDLRGLMMAVIIQSIGINFALTQSDSDGISESFKVVER